MSKENLIKRSGKIKEVFKAGKFLITFELGKGEMHDITCYPNKTVRRNYMGITVGDEVVIEFDRSSPDNGRIISVKNSKTNTN